MSALETPVLDQSLECALPKSIQVTDEAAAHLKAHPEVMPLLNAMVTGLKASVPIVPMQLDVFEEPDIGRDRLLLFLLVAPDRSSAFEEAYKRFWGEWMRSHSIQERLALGLSLHYV